MHSISPHGLIASVIGGGLALAIAFAPIAPSAQTQPSGAVTPAAAPGQFSNSPTTTNSQGGQESLKFDDHGTLQAVGRATFAPKAGVTLARPTAKPLKGKLHNGVWVAPRVILSPHP